ncbi:hypothetical protein UA08_07363 [Talaromyces atroroseus]|uniref:Uncharacterized protein n=1 Tax=Talaromyces atroroseus TaxID=1441469 RepID=A0A225ANM7_TALAT|nr:hypothetical protein UA08_07363 [Talaromyces atroroseus]OKL57209.1 hypothetical protein UA08_07363 [Talaromyces atroroseus]
MFSPTSPALASVSEADDKEKKRQQNRIAQQKYRRNQKARLQALEQAVIGEQAWPKNALDFYPLEQPSMLPHTSSVDDQFMFSEITAPQLGRPVLHRAVHAGNETVIRLLIDRGADINKCDEYGRSVLHVATENGYASIVRLLADHKIDVNAQDIQGRTALFHAVQSGNEEIVELLLSASIDLNCRDLHGNTALHLAVDGGSESLINLLLSHGADVDA